MNAVLDTRVKRITMPCDIESRRPETARKAAWHRDCPRPHSCPCPGHAGDRTPR